MLDFVRQSKQIQQEILQKCFEYKDDPVQTSPEDSFYEGTAYVGIKQDKDLDLDIDI